jgi:hypothetical protein
MPSSRYKERQSCLLLPAKEDLMQWHLEALKATMPLNLYIYEMVEKARRIDTTPDIPRLNETADLKEEISALKKDLAGRMPGDWTSHSMVLKAAIGNLRRIRSNDTRI